MLLSACATSAAPSSTSIPSSAQLPAPESTALLWDRLRIRLPAGVDEFLADSLNGGRDDASRETVYLSDDRGLFMALEVEELFATARGVDHLLAVLRERYSVDADVSAIEAEGRSNLVVVRPRSAVRPDRRGTVLEAFAMASDGYVLSLRFSVAGNEVPTPDAVAFAERLLLTVEAGARMLRDDSGRRAVWPSLTMVVPSGYHVNVEGSYDFEMVRIREAVPFGEPAGEIRIATARMVWPSHSESAERLPWLLLGRPTDLRRWQDDGRIHAESSVLLGGLEVAVHVEAGDGASSNRLLDVVQSLEAQTQPPASTLACPDVSPRSRAIDAEREFPGDPDVDFLRRSTHFVLGDSTTDDGPPSQVRAFRRILRHAGARGAFLDLVNHGTTAGRLYGLSGLWWVDRELFESAACAVRPDLDAEVEVVDACGVTRRSTASILVDPAASRGESFWWAQTWSALLRTTPRDIAGGGLVATLIRPSASRGVACMAGGAGTTTPRTTEMAR